MEDGKRRARRKHSAELKAQGKEARNNNGNRVRLWRLELQRLVDETGLEVQVCHFPPGTSKWNKIEHRMFCHITNNWRGRPLLSRQVVVNLIDSVTTEQGLQVKAALDENTYDAASRSVTPNSPQSTSCATSSTASGIAGSGQRPLVARDKCSGYFC